MNSLIPMGILIIFIGISLIVAGMISTTASSGKSKVAIGGFIGPIPFGFGNDDAMVKFAVITAAIMLLLWIILPRLLK